MKNTRRNLFHSIIGVIIGAISTGIIQYSIVSRQHEKEISKVKIESVISYLDNKYQYRAQQYKIIRRALEILFFENTKENRESAIKLINTEIPFFYPKTMAQWAVMDSKEAILQCLQIPPYEITNEAYQKLLQDFSNDLNSIILERNQYNEELSNR